MDAAEKQELVERLTAANNRRIELGLAWLRANQDKRPSFGLWRSHHNAEARELAEAMEIDSGAFFHMVTLPELQVQAAVEGIPVRVISDGFYGVPQRLTFN
jgi:hypothetical protein